MWFAILAGAAVKSVPVLAGAWLASAALRRRSAAARRLVWIVALAAIVALPFLSAALPAVRVPLPEPAALVFQTNALASLNAGTVGLAAPHSTAAGAGPVAWRPDWRIWLLFVWAAGTAILLARMIAAYAAAWRMRRTARPFPDRDLCASLAAPLGIRGRVDVLASKPGSMPVSFGFRRSAILMPADAAAWDEPRRRAVLLHELAHVRRGDALAHLLGRLAVALYWWNPLAWSAWREFLKERERAADDLVLNAGVRASDYAAHLLEIARTLRPVPVVTWAGTAIARRSQLEGRLLAILDSGVNRTAPGRAAVLAVALLAVTMIAPLAALRAQDDRSAAVPADVEATIRAAQSGHDYQSLEADARAATQVAKYDVAEKLLEAAVSIRAQVSGAQSADYAVGLVKLAELKQKRNPKSGGDLYTKAAQILGDRPEAARALTHLGLLALDKKDYTTAFEFFNHAQHVNPAEAPAALMWKAVVWQREKNFEQADQLFQQAAASQNPTIMRVYAQFLRDRGRAGQANELDDRATAIQNAAGPLPPAIPAGVFRIRQGVTPPRVLLKREPQYTEEGRVARLEGTVVLRIIIGANGLPRDVLVVRGLGLGLDENAIEAINQWQFTPGMKDDQPVPVVATIEVNFRLL